MKNPTAQVSLALLFAQAERYVTDRLDEALRAAGLTVDQYRVLLQLVDGQGHSMTEVAEQAVIAGATLTRVVDRLCQLNLVHRRIDALDRRRVLIFMSHRGAPVLQQVLNQEGELQQEFEGRLGVADLAHLVDTLHAMIGGRATTSTAR